MDVAHLFVRGRGEAGVRINRGLRLETGQLGILRQSLLVVGDEGWVRDSTKVVGLNCDGDGCGVGCGGGGGTVA